MSEVPKIYIGSILLERNRWAKDKQPTYAVSEWAQRFADDGFDGIELWEYHATLCDDAERAALAAAAPQVTIFNSYADMSDADADRRRRNAELTKRFGASGVKFNVGSDPAQRGMYLNAVRQWRSMFPDDVTLLCECHPGTIIEKPGDAKAFFDEVGCDGIKVIVHAFNAVDALAEWFAAFGADVAHAHLQMRNDGNMVSFDSDPDCADEAIGIMKGEGFAGSMTLEFAVGTLAADENIDDLYAAAVADLAFLKERIR